MPGEIVLQLSHKDVFLGFFKELKREVLSLKGGDTLFYKDYTLYNQAQKPVARLSQNMQKKLAEWRERGYEVKSLPCASWWRGSRRMRRKRKRKRQCCCPTWCCVCSLF